MNENARRAATHQIKQHRGSDAVSRSVSRPHKKPTLGWMVLLPLYATLAAFSASYFYGGPLAEFLLTAKWVPLVILALILAVGALRRSALIPTGTLPVLLAAFVAVATVVTQLGPYSEKGLFYLASLILALTTALLLAKRIQYSSAEDSFFQAVVNVGCVVIVSSFLLAMLGLSLGRGDRFSGWTDNPNSLAILLAPTLIILTGRILEGRQKWLSLDTAFLLMGFYVLLLTGSRASIGWVAISLLGFWLARAGFGWLLGGAFLAVLLLMGFDGTFADLAAEGSTLINRAEASGVPNLSGRTEAWVVGVEKFHENPLGFGIGSSASILEAQARRFEVHQGLHFHSSYITALVEVGVLGLLILLIILLKALAAGLQFTTRVQRSPALNRPRLPLEWALLLGAVFHAAMESWLLSAGNANMLLIWVVIALILTPLQNFLPRRRSSLARPRG